MVENRATAVLERPVKGPGRPDRSARSLRARPTRIRPSPVQRAWLERGLDQPGGKLPLFDRQGQAYSPRTIQSCIAQGWAEPWARNPIKPNWLVCRLTEAGRAALGAADRSASG